MCSEARCARFNLTSSKVSKLHSKEKGSREDRQRKLEDHGQDHKVRAKCLKQENGVGLQGYDYQVQVNEAEDFGYLCRKDH